MYFVISILSIVPILWNIVQFIGHKHTFYTFYIMTITCEFIHYIMNVYFCTRYKRQYTDNHYILIK